MYREDRGGVVNWRPKCWHNSQKNLGPKIVGKRRPFREIPVIPRERGWVGGGECDKRASKILFKPIARINLFISNVMHAAHSCSPRFTKVTFPPTPLSWPPPASPGIRSFSFSLLLFCFFVWSSHIESARFVIVYHSCVPVHTTKRSMSRLTNPLHTTDSDMLFPYSYGNSIP